MRELWSLRWQKTSKNRHFLSFTPPDLVTPPNVPIMSMPKLVMIYKPLLKKDTSIVRLIGFKKGFCSKNLHFPRLIYPLKMKLFLENDPNRVTFFFKYLLDFTISISKLVKPESLKNGF